MERQQPKDAFFDGDITITILTPDSTPTTMDDATSRVYYYHSDSDIDNFNNNHKTSGGSSSPHRNARRSRRISRTSRARTTVSMASVTEETLTMRSRRRVTVAARLALACLGVALAAVSLCARPTDDALSLHYVIVSWPVATLVTLFNILDILVGCFRRSPSSHSPSSSSSSSSSSSPRSSTAHLTARSGGGLRPRVTLPLDALLTLGASLCAALVAYFPPRAWPAQEGEWVQRLAGGWWGFANDATVAVAVAGSVAVLELTVFVRACVEVDRRAEEERRWRRLGYGERPEEEEKEKGYAAYGSEWWRMPGVDAKV